MPKAYGYIRVSRDEQVESGLSLEAQEQISRGFWERALRGKGLEWGGLWADEAVSAFKREARRTGKENPALFRREWSWESCRGLATGSYLPTTYGRCPLWTTAVFESE